MDTSSIVPLFTIEWGSLPGTACATDQIVKFLKERDIPWFGSSTFDTVADIDNSGLYRKVRTAPATKSGFTDVFIDMNDGRAWLADGSRLELASPSLAKGGESA